eukprot:Nk52_evm6s272 gene=Nk52_evmTU6s272
MREVKAFMQGHMGRQVLVAMFLTLASLTEYSLSQKPNLPICFVGRFQSGGWGRVIAFNAAMQVYESQPLVNIIWQPNTTYVQNDEANNVLGIEATLNSIQNLHCVLVFGPMNSGVCAVTNSLLTYRGIPQVSASCSSTALSVKRVYPTFVRSLGTVYGETRAKIAWIRHNEWKVVGELYSDDSFGQSGHQVLSELAEEYQYRVHYASPLTPNFGKQELDMSDRVERAIASGVKVFFLNMAANEGLAILKEFDKLNVLSSREYIFIVDFSWNNLQNDQELVAEFGSRLNDILRGMFLSEVEIDQTTSAYQFFDSKYKEFVGMTEGTLAGSWAQFWDATRWIALALNSAVDVLNGLGISPQCLQENYYEANTAACQLPISYRDEIFAKANCTETNCVKQNGVVETMVSRKVNSEDQFGTLARKPSVALLKILYETTFVGATGDFKVDQNGDRAETFKVMNSQTVNGETVWVAVGVANETNMIINPDKHASAVFGGGTENSPNLIAPTDGFVTNSIKPCDLIGESKYHIFEQFSFAIELNKVGTLLSIIFTILIMLGWVVAVTYILLVSSRITKATKKVMEVSIAKANWSNIFALVALFFEYFFIVGICFNARVSWVSGDFTDQLGDTMQMKFAKWFFLVWICLILLMLWVVYSLIFILGLAEKVTESYIGEMFMSPAIIYVDTVGTVGIIPVVGTLFKVFDCSYFPQFSSAYIFSFCEEECFTNSHMSLLILGGLFLTVFVPLNLVTAHIWQEINTDLEILYSRSYIRITQACFFLLIFIRNFLTLFPIQYLCLVMCILLFRLQHIIRNTDCVNVAFTKPFLYINNIGGLCLGLFILITHLVDVSSTAIWPPIVGLLSSVILFAVCLGVSLKIYGKPIAKVRKGSLKNRKFSQLLNELMQKKQRQSSASFYSVYSASSGVQPEEDAMVDSWDFYHHYCVSHKVKESDSKILSQLLLFALQFDEINLSPQQRLYFYLDSISATLTQAGYRWKTKSLRHAEKRANNYARKASSTVESPYPLLAQAVNSGEHGKLSGAKALVSGKAGLRDDLDVLSVNSEGAESIASISLSGLSGILDSMKSEEEPNQELTHVSSESAKIEGAGEREREGEGEAEREN